LQSMSAPQMTSLDTGCNGSRGTDLNESYGLSTSV
jgi:hypothetical protein